MIKEFILQGLNCANCADKIETELNKVDGVISASINIATSKLRIEISTTMDIHKKVENLVNAHEPDVLVLEAKKAIVITDNKAKALWLGFGAVAFAGGVLFEYVFSMTGDRYVALTLFIFSYLLLGGKVLFRMVRNFLKGQVFDENFLMGVATIGAIAIGKFAEAVTVMLFYQIGEFFQEMAVAKSKKRISNLMDIRPDYANVLHEGQLIKINPENIQIGDIFIVKPGEKIPLDGIIIEGLSMLDTTALTGESVPRKVDIGDTALSGCINLNGVLTIEATQVFKESTVSKILDLVENAASKKAPTETFIRKFARYYTPAVVCLAAIIAVMPSLFFGGDWLDWVSRGLIFLVISCPCALVVSIPLGFFGGIGGASRKGILIKGGNYLEALASLEIVVFDKTGTLTKGVFRVTDILPAYGFNENQLLEVAAHAEAFSNHPIGASIIKEYSKEPKKSHLSEYEEIAGHGVQVKIKGKLVSAGNEKLMKRIKVEYTAAENIGTKVYVAIDNTYVGCIVISDEIKPDSRDAIAALKALGVKKTIMLSGDIPQIANAVAHDLALDEVYSGLLPQEKVEKVESLKILSKKTLAFVGDGINDAPVLAMADVGVAMGGLGSDAAIEAADVVLMTDEPGKLAQAVEIARFTKRVVCQNIIVSLSIKFLFLFLATLGVSSLWEAIFADVGVSLLAVFNSMRVLRR